MKSNSFELGERGEAYFKNNLAKRLRMQQCTRYETIEEQAVLGDFLCTTNGGQSINVEVKTEKDLASTGNLAWEIWQDEPTQNKGWSQTLTDCDVLVLVRAENRHGDLELVDAVAFHYPQLRNFVNSRSLRAYRSTKNYGDTRGVLVPIETLKTLRIACTIYPHLILFCPWCCFDFLEDTSRGAWCPLCNTLAFRNVGESIVRADYL